MTTCDVIVVGAGPAGACAAAHLARAGWSVTVLEKATFPRDKVCGDGLTPRAVKEMIELGLPRDQSFKPNRGLRVYGGGHVIELPWPASSTYPPYGLTKPRRDFDQALVDHACSLGATVIERTTVIGPVLDKTGRVIGVQSRPTASARRSTKDQLNLVGPQNQPPASAPNSPKRVQGDLNHSDSIISWRAPLVLAADGGAARLAMSVGRVRRTTAPMGVAIRTYFPSNGLTSDYMESHLELWDGQGHLMPGYGWVFALADGRLNVGCGTVSAHGRTPQTDWRTMLNAWVRNIPGWGLDPDQALEPPRAAALPMAFNRGPLYADGLLLLGDAAGLVSPFNGEGVGEAMRSGRLAAQVCAQALSRPTLASRERALAAYPQILAHELGGYYRLGQMFVELIEHPAVMRLCTRYGLPRPGLMRLTMKLLSGLYEPQRGDWMDRMIAALARLVPAVTT